MASYDEQSLLTTAEEVVKGLVSSRFCANKTLKSYGEKKKEKRNQNKIPDRRSPGFLL